MSYSKDLRTRVIDYIENGGSILSAARIYKVGRSTVYRWLARVELKPIHRKTLIRELVNGQGHEVIFLPKYSPDLNDIEHDFGALKKKRMYEGKDKSIDDIIRDYCAF